MLRKELQRGATLGANTLCLGSQPTWSRAFVLRRGKETRSRKFLLWEPPLLGKQNNVYILWVILNIVTFMSHRFLLLCGLRVSALLGLSFIFKTLFCFEVDLPGACYPVKLGPQASAQQKRQETYSVSFHMPLSRCPGSLNFSLCLGARAWGISLGGSHKFMPFGEKKNKLLMKMLNHEFGWIAFKCKR